MNKEEIFSIWAPDNSLWSRWTKPVLFAHLTEAFSQLPVADVAADVSRFPAPSQKVALVLDLPCAEGVLTGIALAARGYRPAPLYNALPLPFGAPPQNPSTGQPVAAVDVWPILGALANGATKLAQLGIPLDAPPAFLLDAHRRAQGRTLAPDDFDNSSISFTTDFPSANFLVAQGIQTALLIQKDRREPQPDLAHTLRRWQDGGIKLERLRLSPPSGPEPFAVARPSWYGAMFQRALASIGFRRARAGGFGAWLPEASAGG